MAAVLLGLTSITAQIVLLREFLSAFLGNELIVALGLTSWMSLVALGALIGRWLKRLHISLHTLFALLAAESVIPLATVVALRYGRNVLFAPGVTLGPGELLCASAVLLFPFCVFSGMVFTVLLSLAGQNNRRVGPARVYAWESLGSVLGAVAFSVLLAEVVDSFEILILLLIVDELAIGLLCHGSARWLALGAAAGCAVLSLLGVGERLDMVTRGWLFPGHRLVVADDTPYGVIAVTQLEEQYNVFENGVLLAASGEVTSVEERVHYALIQRPNPRRVLLVGGGIGDLTREVLKYNVERVDIAELDPRLPIVGRQLGLLSNDPRIRVMTADARRYVERCSEMYDAVLINSPDPQSLQLNRFFTYEFFGHVKHVLSPGGVVSANLLPSAEYQGREARSLGSALLGTMRSVFTHVLIVPGERYFFLGSDRALDIRIGALIESRGIRTEYVNRNYLVDQQLEQRSEEIMRIFNQVGPINTDYHPVCFFNQMSFWARSFGTGLGLVAVPFIAVLFVVALWARPVGAIVFTAGAAGSALQVIVLFVLQILCGSLYFLSGILIASFMAGLTVGAAAAARWGSGVLFRRLMVLQWLLVLAALGAGCLLFMVRTLGLSDVTLTGLFSAMAFGVAFIVGAQFAVGVRLAGDNGAHRASALYALDLLGSAIGSTLVVMCIIPLFGVQIACLVAALVAALGAGRVAFSHLKGTEA